MSAAALALLCLLATGLLDLTFKLYAAKPRSRGMLIFGIGCVWVTIQLAHIGATGETLSFDERTLLFGGLAALFVTLSNILLLESLGHLPISAASTIYRLNTVPLVVLAFVFLDEDIGGLKAAGIIAGLLTVLLLYRPDRTGQGRRSQVPSYLLVVIAASGLRALYGALTKAGINLGAQPDTMMLFAAVSWCVGGLAYARFRENQVEITWDNVRYAPVAGLLVFLVVWLLTTALTVGDASVVVPIANMGFVAAFVLSLAAGLERVNRRTVAAIGCAALSVVLLTASA